jgi:carboxypeptidase C (cathepsin A)
MNPSACVSHLVSALLAIGVPLLSHAADRAYVASAASPASTAPASAPTETQPHSRNFVTSHTGLFGGTTISYLATAADTTLTDAHGNPAAAVFSFTYTRQGVKDLSKRPVLFIFNGGPGSASLWIHMGALGPRRIATEDPAHPTTVGPFHTVDNPLSPLDIADLVFIDPVGTGFSHVVGGGKPEEFYGVNEDAKATADFIIAWLTRNHRWNSPKFVLGESYGTTRAAVLAKALGGGPFGGGTLPGVSLNGIVLLGLSMGSPGEDAETQLLLPSLAATAWYHGKVDKKGRTFEEFVSEVRQFAATEYGSALFAGSRLPESQRQVIAAKLAAFTSLSESFILEHDLRISSGDFAEQVLHDRAQETGRYDARFALPRAGSGHDPVADDPAMGQYTPGYVATFNDYLQTDLGITLEQRYEVISFAAVNSRWNWAPGSPSTLRGPELATAMRRNPSMKLLVGSGYYDLVTPFAAAQYTIDHVEIPPDRVTFRNYESGHMVYLGEGPAHAFVQDLREFLSH